MSNSSEDNYFYSLLCNPIENEDQIIAILWQRFQEIQSKQNILVKLVIDSEGSADPIEVNTNDKLVLRIPFFQIDQNENEHNMMN